MPRYKATSEGNIPFTPAEEQAADKRDANWLSGADDRLADKHRVTRNDLLVASDWTQIPDSALTDEAKDLWVTYRTALRNLPAHENWPNVSDNDWPTKPS